MSGYDGPGVVVTIADTELAGLRVPLRISPETFVRAMERADAGDEDAPEVLELKAAIAEAYAPRDEWAAGDDAALLMMLGGGHG